jgi:hypothetical protein
VNKDLIERKRKELNAQRKAHHKNELKMDIGCAARSVDMHSIEEIEFLGIMVDRFTTAPVSTSTRGNLKYCWRARNRKIFLSSLRACAKITWQIELITVRPEVWFDTSP